MDRVLSEEESHKAKPQIIQTLKKNKKSSYGIGRNSNHMEVSGVLEQQEDKAPPDCSGQAKGRVW